MVNYGNANLHPSNTKYWLCVVVGEYIISGWPRSLEVARHDSKVADIAERCK